MDLGIDVTDRGDWAVLSVTGEIDVATAPQLREELVELVADGRNRIVVDLSGVDFLDSTGLGVLVGGLKRVRTHDGELSLACAQPRVRRVFEITGLTQVFPIHETVDAATTAD